jgi:hypothetical protein
VVLYWGTNDACATAECHVPIADFAANLEQLVRFFQSKFLAPSPEIVIITPGPTNHPGFNNTQAGLYAASAVQLAKKMNISYLGISVKNLDFVTRFLLCRSMDKNASRDRMAKILARWIAFVNRWKRLSIQGIAFCFWYVVLMASFFFSY